MLFIPRLLIAFMAVGLCLQFTDAVGKTKKRKPSSSSDQEHKSRSLWLTLPKETLQLLATNHHLNTRGNIAVLAGRLLNHFNPPSSLTLELPTSSSPSSSTENLSTAIPPFNNEDFLSRIGEIVRTEVQRQFNSVSTEILTATSDHHHAAIPPLLPTRNTYVDFVPSQPAYSSIVNQDGGHHSTTQAAASLTRPQSNHLASLLIVNHSDDIYPTSAIAPAVQQSNNAAHMLPTVPPAQLKKIINRENTDFNLLLSDSSVTPGSYSIEINSNTDRCNYSTLSLVPKSASKKIQDFFSWIQAWNNFMRAYVFHFPEMSYQLMFYQSIICQYAQQYVFEDVLEYDRNFRIRIANGHSLGLRWDRHDPELVARFLRTFKPVCYRCKQFSYYASSCPFSTRSFQSSPGYNQPFRAPQLQNTRRGSIASTSSSTPAVTQHQPYRLSNTRTTSRPTHCYFFSQFGHCDRRECNYPHTCQSCNGPHSRTHCPDRSTRQ